MADITIKLGEDALALVAQMRGWRDRVLPAMAGAIDLQNEVTVGHIQADYLSARGPETLGVITNRLRSSIRPRASTMLGNAIISGIGSNVRYMGAHEFGFDGTVNVKAHSRELHFYEGQQVSRADAKGMRGKMRQRLKSVTRNVRAHTREVHIRARAPIRHGIEDRVDAYSNAIAEALQRVWAGGN